MTHLSPLAEPPLQNTLAQQTLPCADAAEAVGEANVSKSKEASRPSEHPGSHVRQLGVLMASV